MKTTILLTIEHKKPLPDITDVICSRVWPYGGGCITDMTAAIQEAEAVEPDSIQAVDLKPDGTPRRYTWDWSTGRLSETQRGLWVRYADHAAAIRDASIAKMDVSEAQE